MFDFWKNKKNNKNDNNNKMDGTFAEHPLVDALLRNADYIMENGYINEDSIPYVRMAVQTAKMRTQQEMELYSFVVDECEKLMVNCKDEKFRKMEEDIIVKMKKKLEEMKGEHIKLTVSYLNLIKSLENTIKK